MTSLTSSFSVKTMGKIPPSAVLLGALVPALLLWGVALCIGTKKKEAACKIQTASPSLLEMSIQKLDFKRAGSCHAPLR
ncbi:hypothetical protein GW626_01755 [Peribacillus muralis]|uniref:hypothetical protein n=1 Tax=Peribacillus muralis TaxID=264697 RepID=UPI001F4E0EEB|nr:hypothetical protein [Peribacillus muralis]MCK1994961.1 hypothetical protein [Peribacillus muralis]MCK2015493.1 hypothetical protein [Peribacillus muralis]